jgi:uncharacterized membrane protein
MYHIAYLNSIKVLHYLLLILVSLFLVGDLFLNQGEDATFDGPVHRANISSIYRGLSEGELRVTWADGFANYGMPIPLISQQVTSYAGALTNFVTNDIVVSYKLVYVFGAILSTICMYEFLSLHSNPWGAFTGALLFNFAPYRIINIYSRGALPEFFASVWIPLILIGLYKLIRERKTFGAILITISTALLILTHPFVTLIAAFIWIPYMLLLLKNSKGKVKLTAIVAISMLSGIAICSYYLVPLFGELKYFYQGQYPNTFKDNQFLGVNEFLRLDWNYFDDKFTRGYTIAPGVIESILFLIAITGSIKMRKENPKSSSTELLQFSVITGATILLLTTSFSKPVYQYVSFLANIQYPWRMMTAFMMIPPIIAAVCIDRYRSKAIIVVVIASILIARFPQLYGKNFTVYPDSSYYFTIHNLHGSFLNTIWTGATQNYPVHKEKVGIIKGDGKIISKEIKNSSRKYEVDAKEILRMIDYTFYFPGWAVYIDNKKTEIEYQDFAYKGVITYQVPPGKHTIVLRFEDTKLRQFATLATYISIGGTALFFFVLNKKHNFLKSQ